MLTAGYIYAILTGLFFGLQGAYGKKIMTTLSPLMVAWSASFFSLPYLLFYLILDGIPPILWKDFIWSTLVSFGINSFAWYYFYHALKKSPLAHTMPFTAFTPVFLIPVAYILINELPDLKGVTGILFVFIGGYTIHLEPGKIWSPLVSLRRNSGTRVILVVAFLWSITATAEKVAVLSSSQPFYGSVIGILLSAVYLPVLLKSGRLSARLIRTNIISILILGMISGLTLMFQFTALKYLLVSYVVSFKRAGVIISVIIGIHFFHEKNAVKNILSTLIMITGIFLILL